MRNSVDADLGIEIRGGLADICLNRHKALNALTTGMRATLSAALPSFARDPMVYAIAIRSSSDKAFCVGGDVREVIDLARADVRGARKALADEYMLNWQHECFSKPTIALIDGLVMGSGVGITAYGTHRVAGEKYRFAMPETAIGLFPDVGVCHLLARMPDHIGMYLGLTGRRIGRADAFELGLVTHCIASSAFGNIVTEIADIQPVDPVLDGRHVDPGPPALTPHRGVISDCFSADCVEDIVTRLLSVRGSTGAWAHDVAQELLKSSPLSLKVTHRHIGDATVRDLRQTLQVDYRLVCRFLESHDFQEGVRAALIDKDNAPQWRPGELEDVTSSIVNDFFSSLGDEELTLPTRQEMQAARS